METKPEGYYVGAYWGPRKETALECARRAELFFHMLARCDPSFPHWYHAGRGFPRELPGWLLRPEVGELEKFFLKGRSRTDVGKVVIEDLGYPVAWHVADAKVAEFLRKYFKERNWNNTTVHYTPAR